MRKENDEHEGSCFERRRDEASKRLGGGAAIDDIYP